eukprot:TRINITY_DN9005_c0_g1_i1.p1 TRINITY_DN9005_c0_g1~~TRINITY_DN9005_c0_g1_i1.p1  ORF type:complete len:2086 (-),score=374.20 TRINITY_DN9005_c0_g1_i1:767-7024(-)
MEVESTALQPSISPESQRATAPSFAPHNTQVPSDAAEKRDDLPIANSVTIENPSSFHAAFSSSHNPFSPTHNSFSPTQESFSSSQAAYSSSHDSFSSSHATMQISHKLTDPSLEPSASTAMHSSEFAQSLSGQERDQNPQSLSHLSSEMAFLADHQSHEASCALTQSVMDLSQESVADGRVEVQSLDAATLGNYDDDAQRSNSFSSHHDTHSADYVGFVKMDGAVESASYQESQGSQIFATSSQSPIEHTPQQQDRPTLQQENVLSADVDPPIEEVAVQEDSPGVSLGLPAKSTGPATSPSSGTASTHRVMQQQLQSHFSTNGTNVPTVKARPATKPRPKPKQSTKAPAASGVPSPGLNPTDLQSSQGQAVLQVKAGVLQPTSQPAQASTPQVHEEVHDNFSESQLQQLFPQSILQSKQQMLHNHLHQLHLQQQHYQSHPSHHHHQHLPHVKPPGQQSNIPVQVFSTPNGPRFHMLIPGLAANQMIVAPGQPHQGNIPSHHQGASVIINTPLPGGIAQMMPVTSSSLSSTTTPASGLPAAISVGFQQPSAHNTPHLTSPPANPQNVSALTSGQSESQANPSNSAAPGSTQVPTPSTHHGQVFHLGSNVHIPPVESNPTVINPMTAAHLIYPIAAKSIYHPIHSAQLHHHPHLSQMNPQMQTSTNPHQQSSLHSSHQLNSGASSTLMVSDTNVMPGSSAPTVMAVPAGMKMSSSQSQTQIQGQSLNSTTQRSPNQSPNLSSNGHQSSHLQTNAQTSTVQQNQSNPSTTQSPSANAQAANTQSVAHATSNSPFMTHFLVSAPSNSQPTRQPSPKPATMQSFSLSSPTNPTNQINSLPGTSATGSSNQKSTGVTQVQPPNQSPRGQVRPMSAPTSKAQADIEVEKSSHSTVNRTKSIASKPAQKQEQLAELLDVFHGVLTACANIQVMVRSGLSQLQTYISREGSTLDTGGKDSSTRDKTAMKSSPSKTAKKDASDSDEEMEAGPNQTQSNQASSFQPPSGSNPKPKPVVGIPRPSTQPKSSVNESHQSAPGSLRELVSPPAGKQETNTDFHFGVLPKKHDSAPASNSSNSSAPKKPGNRKKSAPVVKQDDASNSSSGSPPTQNTGQGRPPVAKSQQANKPPGARSSADSKKTMTSQTGAFIITQYQLDSHDSATGEVSNNLNQGDSQQTHLSRGTVSGGLQGQQDDFPGNSLQQQQHYHQNAPLNQQPPQFVATPDNENSQPQQDASHQNQSASQTAKTTQGRAAANPKSTPRPLPTSNTTAPIIFPVRPSGHQGATLGVGHGVVFANSPVLQSRAGSPHIQLVAAPSGAPFNIPQGTSTPMAPPPHAFFQAAVQGPHFHQNHRQAAQAGPKSGQNLQSLQQPHQQAQQNSPQQYVASSPGQQASEYSSSQNGRATPTPPSNSDEQGRQAFARLDRVVTLPSEFNQPNRSMIGQPVLLNPSQFHAHVDSFSGHQVFGDGFMNSSQMPNTRTDDMKTGDEEHTNTTRSAGHGSVASRPSPILIGLDGSRAVPDTKFLTHQSMNSIALQSPGNVVLGMSSNGPHEGGVISTGHRNSSAAPSMSFHEAYTGHLQNQVHHGALQYDLHYGGPNQLVHYPNAMSQDGNIGATPEMYAKAIPADQQDSFEYQHVFLQNPIKNDRQNIDSQENRDQVQGFTRGFFDDNQADPASSQHDEQSLYIIGGVNDSVDDNGHAAIDGQHHAEMVAYHTGMQSMGNPGLRLGSGAQDPILSGSLQPEFTYESYQFVHDDASAIGDHFPDGVSMADIMKEGHMSQSNIEAGEKGAFTSQMSFPETTKDNSSSKPNRKQMIKTYKNDLSKEYLEMWTKIAQIARVLFNEMKKVVGPESKPVVNSTVIIEKTIEKYCETPDSKLLWSKWLASDPDMKRQAVSEKLRDLIQGCQKRKADQDSDQNQGGSRPSQRHRSSNNAILDISSNPATPLSESSMRSPMVNSLTINFKLEPNQQQISFDMGSTARKPMLSSREEINQQTLLSGGYNMGLSIPRGSALFAREESQPNQNTPTLPLQQGMFFAEERLLGMPMIDSRVAPNANQGLSSGEPPGRRHVFDLQMQPHNPSDRKDGRQGQGVRQLSE